MPSRATVFKVVTIALLLLAGAELVACEMSGSASERHDCLYCCIHIALAAPFVFVPTEETAAVAPPPEIQFSSRQPAGIYHPPRV